MTPRPLRVQQAVLLVLTVLLYGIPWYQDQLNPSRPTWSALQAAPAPLSPRPANPTAEYREDFVNRAQRGVMCHVPSLAAAAPGEILCTWYAGSREGARDVAIYAARFREERGDWSTPQVLLDPARCSRELRRAVRKLGNAVVMADAGGRLWLFFAANVFGGWSTTSLHVKVSSDGGATWTPSRKLILSPFFNLTQNVKNKGVLLSDGSFLLPVYHEFLRKFSQVLHVRPGPGAPPYEIRTITRTGKAVQPALVPQGDRDLTAFCRNMASQERKFVQRADSPDQGQTWTSLQDTSLPNPNAGFDLLGLGGGGILGVVNPSFYDRSQLALVLSRDGGRTWRTLKVLEQAAGREYSYPALISRGEVYHVAYTYERQRIKHLRFNEAWLQGLPSYGD